MKKPVFKLIQEVGTLIWDSTTLMCWARMINLLSHLWPGDNISVLNGALWDMGRVHCGICESGWLTGSVWNIPCNMDINWQDKFVPCWIYLRKHKYVHAFSIVSQYWDGTDSWNFSSWKSRACLPCTVNTMAADDLATQGAKASAAHLVLT